MLFHVKATHTEDNCPMYNTELMPGLLESWSKREDVEQEVGVKVHFEVVDTPAHTVYSLVEADSVSAVSRWAFSSPLKQRADIRPVEQIGDVAERAQAMADAAG